MQIKYVDTKNQLADILTKSNSTRDAWNHLSPFVQYRGHFNVFILPFQQNRLSSDHIELADTGKKTERR